MNDEQRKSEFAYLGKLAALKGTTPDRIAQELGLVEKRLKVAAALRPLREQHMIQWASELVASSPDDAAGGNGSNTPPAISQGETSTMLVGSGEFAGGEDWLEVSLWIRWEGWDQLRTLLDAKKSQARAQADGHDTQRGDCLLTVDDDEFVMMPTGTASDGKGPRYSWRLKRDGITYCIANRESPDSPYPSMKIVVGSLPLMVRSAEQVWEICKRDISNLGGEIVKNVLSRVDVCVDLAGVSVEEFILRKRSRQYICRAVAGEEFEASVHTVGERCTGFRIGARGAALSLNVYDKLHEVCQKNDEAKLAALIEHRWGGAMPDCATRVEWRFHREKLAALEITSVESWFEKRLNVFAYVSEDWVRFTEGEVDREQHHHGRASVWSVWEKIKSAAQRFFGGCAMSASKCAKKVVFDFEALNAQTLGTLSSMIVYGQGVVADLDTFKEIACQRICSAIDSRDWRGFVMRQSRKRSLYEASQPASRLGPEPLTDREMRKLKAAFGNRRALCGTS